MLPMSCLLEGKAGLAFGKSYSRRSPVRMGQDHSGVARLYLSSGLERHARARVNGDMRN
jgi:hypothetical protein